MNSISESVYAAKDKILGSISQATQSGDEPSSGTKGAGTADEPYDQGNKLDAPGSEGIEPPSGQAGSGTADQPYDQGNQPEQDSKDAEQNVSRANIEPTSPSSPPKKKGQGIPITLTKTSISDIDGGAKDTSERSVSSANAEPTSLSSPPKKKGQGIPITLTKTETSEEERGRDTSESAATATSNENQPASKWPVSDAGKRLERSVSPATLPDGSHAQTSGDRGESYAPGKIDKLKGKFRFGKD